MDTGSSHIYSMERDRRHIPEEYTWRIADLSPSVETWRESRTRLAAEIPSLQHYRGTLASSARTLLECLTLISRISKEYDRLHTYASLSLDVDTRNSSAQAMVQEMSQMGSDLAARTAFVQPEILAMGRSVVDAFLRAEPGLSIYRHTLDDMLRRKEHTGTEGEERIIAEAGLMADSPDSIYGVFSDADFPFPEVSLSSGVTARLDKAAFSMYRDVPNREDRKAVFGTYFGRLHEYRRTFGAQLYAQVKRDLFYARARNYPSCLHSALDGSNIPVEVYTGFIRNVHDNLSIFHRSLDLRRKLLGIDELHYYDLYCPIVRGIDLQFTYEESQTHVLESLRPLGEEYVEVVRQAFADRWIDVFPGEGKRSGAYSSGAAYDVHPYILLNYNGKYDDLSTLAHELGHTVHSSLSNARQPYPTSHYSIFVAEVASTLNEALLLEHMLGAIAEPSVRLSLLGEYLDGIRATVFRQTQFAEFELRIHEAVERGETLTGDGLNDLYADLTRGYYGHGDGVCVVDDVINVEWAHIPHFFYTFYVYQYATSFTASSAIAEKILAGDRNAVRAYLELLSSGGSDYPMALLRRAGVDMTSAEPFHLTMRRMNRVMDEIERLSA